MEPHYSSKQKWLEEAANIRKSARFWKLVKFATMQRQNGHFGSECQRANNIRKTVLEPHQSCSLQKMVFRAFRYFVNEMFLSMKCAVRWPEREELLLSMPTSCAAIIEVFTEWPSCLQTWPPSPTITQSRPWLGSLHGELCQLFPRAGKDVYQTSLSRNTVVFLTNSYLERWEFDPDQKPQAFRCSFVNLIDEKSG